jgi:hypothetical protein
MKTSGRSVLVSFAAFCLALVLSFSGCSRSNIFGWAHSAGSVKTTTALSADAYTALQNKDYAKAIDYFTQILASEPGNSEAIYGYAVAQLGSAGIDIASLITNMITNQNPAVSHLSPAIASLVSAAPGTNLLPSTILANKPAIMAALDKILDPTKLPKIANGTADGKIKPDDADVNVNLAFCYLLRAALRLTDYVQFNTDYSVDSITNVSAAKNPAIESCKDIIRAYHRVQVVVGKLEPGKKTSLTDLSGDINTLLGKFKTQLVSDGVLSQAEADSLNINNEY